MKRSYHLIILLFLSSCVKLEEADMVLHNGTIQTMGIEMATYQAMAVKDGKIVQLGSEHEILNKYWSDNMIDLKKQFVYPAFIETSFYPFGYGWLQSHYDLKGWSKREVLNFDYNLNPGLNLMYGLDAQSIDEQFLDQLDWLFKKDSVVIKTYDGWGLYFSPFLRSENSDQRYLHDQDLVPIVWNIYRNRENNSLSELYKQAMDSLLRFGICAFQTVENSEGIEKVWPLYDSLSSPVDVRLAEFKAAGDTSEVKLSRLDKTNKPTVFIRIDGGIASGDAWVFGSKPLNETLWSGDDPYKKLKDQIMRYGQQYYRIVFQCFGDSALDFVLKQCEDVLGGPNDRRWRIANAQMSGSDQEAMLRTLSIIPDMCPQQYEDDMKWLRVQEDSSLAERSYRFDPLYEANKMLLLASVAPVGDINPMSTYSDYLKATGNDIRHRRIGLKALTIFAAIAMKMEEKRGDLQSNLNADFVIFKENLLEVELDGLEYIYPEATFISGIQVFPKN